jgi:hypothetical protein
MFHRQRRGSSRKAFLAAGIVAGACAIIGGPIAARGGDAQRRLAALSTVDHVLVVQPEQSAYNADITDPAPVYLPAVLRRTAGGPQPDFPVRAAFYYPWFPEAWTQSGLFPFTHYTPTLGYYDLRQQPVIEAHLRAMQYAKIQAGIASWWGIGTHTDAHFAQLLSATTAAGSAFRWSLYYEAEAGGDPGPPDIASDLAYIRKTYAGDRSYWRADDKFVIFVYADSGDGCGMATRWKQARTGLDAYIVLKVFPGYKNCADQPDNWHQYSPAVATDTQGAHSYSISPGFWHTTGPQVLGRDLARWRSNVRDMVASGAQLQLVTTFNEWGEGTAVESATSWQTVSGYGAYLDALHTDGAP